MGQSAKVYVGMRYWKPFTEDALEQVGCCPELTLAALEGLVQWLN